jgi:hypothetical protein
MRKLIAFFLLALTLSNVVTAQSFPKPPDVPNYVSVAGTLAGGTTHNTVSVVTSVTGEATDIPTPDTGWVFTATTGAGYCNIGTCPENKARFEANFSHFASDDPIRNWGQPGASHRHMFFGSESASAFSTFPTLRTKKGSTISGGEKNKSAYWVPAMLVPNAFGDGKTYAHKPDYIVVYYNGYDGTKASEFSRFMLGQRNVFGRNMDDPEDTQVKKEIAEGNVAAGFSRYTYTGDGFMGYYCDAETGGTTDYVDHLGPTDPFANLGTLGPGGCPAGNHIVMELRGPTHWDCTNLWSPGGYKHYRQGVNDSVVGGEVGPNGWCRQAAVIYKILYYERGPSDYTRWKLSSDAALETKWNSLPDCTAGYANAPCKSAGTHTVAQGWSGHGDYMLGWDGSTLRNDVMKNCIGTEGGIPYECEVDIIGLNKWLIGTTGGAAPDGRNPQVNTANHQYDTSTPSKMELLPASPHGPMTHRMFIIPPLMRRRRRKAANAPPTEFRRALC